MSIPEQLNHYRIVAPLGKGGMGEVFVAEDTKLQRKVALKVLSALMASDPERRQRFEREAQAVAALNHPNIVTIHSVEEDRGIPFLTMELVEGRPLNEVMTAGPDGARSRCFASASRSATRSPPRISAGSPIAT